jgi:ApbE superfamily uncharacterized protein (UPF0280 family)
MAQARIADGRLHLNDGPIDAVIGAWGEPAEVAAAYAQATAAFEGVLSTLVGELPLLRRPIGDEPPTLSGPVARRMLAAVWPHRAVFVTPMAAVAGAVADHLLGATLHGRRLDKAFVNDGGDIALHLGRGQRFRIGMVADLAAPGLDGTIEIAAADAVRGIATSGRGGRSFSLGIADAVTVLARDAAAADAAATLIANAVDVEHPSIERQPARALDPDSDLGELPVTVAVGELDDASVALALERGVARAAHLVTAGLIVAAALRLRGRQRLVGARPGPEAPVPQVRRAGPGPPRPEG